MFRRAIPTKPLTARSCWGYFPRFASSAASSATQPTEQPAVSGEVPVVTLVLKGSRRVYEQAHTHYKPDTCFMLDLQDGVPPQHKPAVRKLLVECFEADVFRNLPVILRLNEYAKRELLDADLLAMGPFMNRIKGFVIPMLGTADELIRVESLLEAESRVPQRSTSKAHDGNFELYPLIETPFGVKNAFDIAFASRRVKGMYFGDVDLSLATGAHRALECQSTARQLHVLACSAAGVHALDGAYTKVDDLIGFEQECRTSRKLGMVGRMALHPKQVPSVRAAYMPSAEEVSWAEETHRAMAAGNAIREEHEQSGRSFMGAPHRKLAERIAQQRAVSGSMPAVSEAVKPRLSRGGIDLARNPIGTSVPSNFELTVSEGMMNQWDTVFFPSKNIHCSDHFAQRLGFPNKLVPNSMLMFLAIGLAVNQFSEPAKVHLGMKHARYLKPVFPGDSLRGCFTVLSVRKSNSGKGSIVRSHHFLKNQRDETVYQLEKWTMFPDLQTESAVSEVPDISSSTSEVEKHFLSPEALSKAQLTRQSPPLEVGGLMAHRLVKVYGESEVRGICHIMRLTNAHHYDTVMFQTQEILVPGPLITHTSLACAAIDLGEVLYEEVISAGNITKVNQRDVIGALTFTKWAVPLEGNPALERVRLVTVGVKNVNIQLLAKESIPTPLFVAADLKPSHVTRLCEQIPMLTNRIACITEYEVVRPRPLGAKI